MNPKFLLWSAERNEQEIRSGAPDPPADVRIRNSPPTAVFTIDSGNLQIRIPVQDFLNRAICYVELRSEEKNSPPVLSRCVQQGFAILHTRHSADRGNPETSGCKHDAKSIGKRKVCLSQNISEIRIITSGHKKLWTGCDNVKQRRSSHCLSRPFDGFVKRKSIERHAENHWSYTLFHGLKYIIQ
jgi:hypothetical protein